MFSLKLNDKDIVMKITVTKVPSTNDIINNVIGNLITNAGGDIASKINLILTDDTLYMEYIGHASIGYAEETRKIEKISLNDLKEFSVANSNDKELITISTENKTYSFEKEDSMKNGLALAMANVINKKDF